MRALSLAIVVLLGTVPLCRGQTFTPPGKTGGGGSGGAGSKGAAESGSSTMGGSGSGLSSAAATLSGALDDLLSQALKSNPDVRLAESKVREAEADLNRVRMQIMQKIVKLEIDIKEAKE